VTAKKTSLYRLRQLYHDRFLTLADFDAYIEAQNRVGETYRVRPPLSLPFFNISLICQRMIIKKQEKMINEKRKCRKGFSLH
jgi:hypothetical protein